MKIPRIALLIVPLLLYGIGFTMNAVVVAANHGQMPVLYPGGCDDQAFAHTPIHTCMKKESRLKFLSDWILIRDVGIASPGDFFEWFGELTIFPLLAGFLVLYFNDRRYFGL